MANTTTGSNVKGGEIVNVLEDVRWPLVDAADKLETLGQVLRLGTQLLHDLEALLEESRGALVRAQTSRGADHFLDSELVRSEGLTIKRPRRRPSPSVKIDEDEQLRIVSRRQGGETLAEIGAHYGVSRQRIQQIVDRHHSNGGSNGSNGHDAHA